MPNKKLKAFQTMELASAVVYRYKAVLAKALVILVILYIAKDYIYSLFVDAPYTSLSSYYFSAPPIVAIKIILLTLIAITIHRVILLGTDSVPTWGIRPGAFWSRRETHFLLYLLLFQVIDYIVVLLFYNGLELVAFSLVVIKLYVLVRISLIFPSLAADKPISPQKSWRLTANYQGYMLTIILVPLFVLNIWVFLWATSFSGFPFSLFLILLAEIIFYVYIVSILSVAYWKIRQNKFANDTQQVTIKRS